MSTTDDVLRALADMEQRLTDRIDRLEERLTRVEGKVDILGVTLLSPHEQAQHKFLALVAKADGRAR